MPLAKIEYPEFSPKHLPSLIALVGGLKGQSLIEKAARSEAVLEDALAVIVDQQNLIGVLIRDADETRERLAKQEQAMHHLTRRLTDAGAIPAVTDLPL